MKYNKDLYVDSGIYGMDEDIRNHKEKIVKCRKPHSCVSCEKEIERGEQALLETGFCEAGAVSAYTCLECIEQWLEESGQVNLSEESED